MTTRSRRTLSAGARQAMQVVQRYVRVTTPGLRIRSWVCEENANNQVVQTKEGVTGHVLPGPGPIANDKIEN
jgi:hypothetical protein